MKKPLISIVTVVYNGATQLEATLNSAWDQTWPEKEIIVVDGGSNDGTQELIRRLEDKINKWISGPDRGIYDAMNKGVEMASGDFVYFLNVGDSFLHNRVLENIFSRKEAENADLIYAKVQTANDPTGVTRIVGQKVELSSFYFGIPICHQATFTRRSAFDRIGKYDISYQITADQEWFIRLFKKYPEKAVFLDELVALYEIVGASFNRRSDTLKEQLRYCYRYFPAGIRFINTLRYPFLQLKVWLIRRLLHNPVYHRYRRIRFGT